MVEKKMEDAIEKVITGLVDRFQEELFSCEEEDLERYWYFKYNGSLPLHLTLYDFFESLELYHGFCRRWEEHKNGSTCVVERVRDKYLMPKIRQLIKDMGE
uniref:Uncharacterized protein n=1 Tax=viral metagenome TaxID=1070528 RepID=A0A6M3KXZ4_9ZZZZ